MRLFGSFAATPIAPLLHALSYRINVFLCAGVLVDIEKYTGNRSLLTALIAELATELKAWHPDSQLSFALSVIPNSQSAFYDHLALIALITFEDRPFSQV